MESSAGMYSKATHLSDMIIWYMEYINSANMAQKFCTLGIRHNSWDFSFKEVLWNRECPTRKLKHSELCRSVGREDQCCKLLLNLSASSKNLTRNSPRDATT